jgi:hypothetical protein
MSFVRKSILASMVFATALGVAGQAHATRIFKGVAVITARTNTPACVLQYDVSESFTILYDANLGTEPRPERISIVGPHGSILITSSDATMTLRGAGQVNISGNYVTAPVSVPSTTVNLAISAVTQATSVVTISGTANNAGVPGCTVTIRAALTYLPPAGY